MKTPPSYVSTSCSSNAAIFREYRHWPCANPGPVPTTPVTPPMALPGPSCSYSAVRRGDNSMMAPRRPPPTSFPPPTHPDKWTSPSTATTYLSKVSQKKKKKKQRAVKNFISWKWNLVRVQVYPPPMSSNIGEHSNTQIHPAQLHLAWLRSVDFVRDCPLVLGITRPSI